MTMPKILITRAIPDEAMALLTPHFEIEHYDKHTAIPRPMLLSISTAKYSSRSI